MLLKLPEPNRDEPPGWRQGGAVSLQDAESLMRRPVKLERRMDAPSKSGPGLYMELTQLHQSCQATESAPRAYVHG